MKENRVIPIGIIPRTLAEYYSYPKACGWYGCHEPIPEKETFCERHRKQEEHDRD